MEQFRKMRRWKQQILDEECISILKSMPRGILSLHGENGYPYAIPVNQYYDEGDGRLYFHGAKQGLKLDLIAQDNKACFTIMDEGFVKEGEWAKNIRSVVCLGHLEVLEDHDKVLVQCRKLAEKFYPTEGSIDRVIEHSGNNVNMLVMTIDRMTGKLVKES